MRELACGLLAGWGWKVMGWSFELLVVFPWLRRWIVRGGWWWGGESGGAG